MLQLYTCIYCRRQQLSIDILRERRSSAVLRQLIATLLLWAHPSLHRKRHLDQFNHFCTVHHRVALYFTTGCHSPKLPLPLEGTWGSGLPSNTWFLGLTRVSNPNGNSIGSSVIAEHMNVTNRQTNRQTNRPRYSVV